MSRASRARSRSAFEVRAAGFRRRPVPTVIAFPLRPPFSAGLAPVGRMLRRREEDQVEGTHLLRLGRGGRRLARAVVVRRLLALIDVPALRLARLGVATVLLLLVRALVAAGLAVRLLRVVVRLAVRLRGLVAATAGRGRVTGCGVAADTLLRLLVRLAGLVDVPGPRVARAVRVRTARPRPYRSGRRDRPARTR